eukprot:TRINITY_DN6531_c0_g2_i2.p1 TRINITY_DN6531_c0_g2~~TRINITY_DN6531_c0_g2_i2.p1  ORF type:complete len:228 (-),score=5.05 TRINITY_DN6531_c0_g2_i2:360-1043(-)
MILVNGLNGGENFWLPSRNSKQYTLYQLLSRFQQMHSTNKTARFFIRYKTQLMLLNLVFQNPQIRLYRSAANPILDFRFPNTGHQSIGIPNDRNFLNLEIKQLQQTFVFRVQTAMAVSTKNCFFFVKMAKFIKLGAVLNGQIRQLYPCTADFKLLRVLRPVFLNGIMVISEKILLSSLWGSQTEAGCSPFKTFSGGQLGWEFGDVVNRKKENLKLLSAVQYYFYSGS